MQRLRAASLIFAFLLGACGGLGGEPNIVATFAPPTRNAASVHSGWQPDISEGERIFAEHCADCHGISGDGQGELVLSGSVPAPIDMTDLALTADKSPLNWFEIITDGRIENLMPPWRSALSERQRWDVTLYAYTLAYDGEWLAMGERVWREKCPDCALPGTVPPVFSDRDYARSLNRERFASALEPREALAAAAKARMVSLQSGGKETPRNTDAVVPVGSFTGRVEHGSAGGTVPPNTQVQLRYGIPEQGYHYAETAVDADNRFSFDDVPLSSAYSYTAGLVYDGRAFSRRMKAGRPVGGEYDLTITIYDATHDAYVISLTAIELYLNPVRMETLGKGLHATQILRYRNSSDRVYTSGRGFEDGREASLLVQFPMGAHILSDDAGGRYVIIENLERVPDSLIDTLAVPPGGAHEIVLEYFLPYDDGLRFEQTFNNLADAEITIGLPQKLEIASPALKLRGDGGDVNHGKVYSGVLKGQNDARLRFQIAGDPFATSSGDRRIITSEVLLPALFALGALAAALAGGLVLWRRGRAGGDNAIDRLSRQIARLDDEHDRGQINHDVYHQRRRQLKEELAALMDSGRDGR